MTRGRGGFIGANVVPAAAAFNSAASGLWTVREAEGFKRAGTWPTAFVNPTNLAGLQLWLDASDASTLYDATTGGSLVAVDGAIARWEDKSGNARHVTQATSGNRPTRKASVLNGRDAILFDGSDDGLAVPNTFGQWGSGNWSMFMAVRTGTSVTSKYLFSSVSDPPSGLFIWSVGDDIRVRTAGGSTQTLSPALSAATSTGVITSVIRNGTTFTGRIGASSNTATTSSNGLSFDGATVEIGIYNEPGFRGLPWNGHVCEVIAYDSALSDTNRTIVESYLKSKWGIS